MTHSAAIRSSGAPGAAPGPARVALVILHFEALSDTLSCLDSVAALTRPPDRLIVIDNGSSADPSAAIMACYPRVELRRNARNLGFGGGHNPWLAELLAQDIDWIWLLNNDTRVEPESLQAMLEYAASEQSLGAVGATLRALEPPHPVLAIGGGRVQPWLGRSRHVRSAAVSPDYITGACLLLRADALRQCGLFDPGYFMYWEDVDLCFRLRAAGWTLGVATAASVFHAEGATGDLDRPLRAEWLNASAVRFFRQHGPLGGWPAIVVGVGARLCKRLFSLRMAEASAVLRGALQGLQSR